MINYVFSIFVTIIPGTSNNHYDLSMLYSIYPRGRHGGPPHKLHEFFELLLLTQMFSWETSPTPLENDPLDWRKEPPFKKWFLEKEFQTSKTAINISDSLVEKLWKVTG